MPPPQPSNVEVQKADKPQALASAWVNLVAGGFAGAISRTCVAPLERTKIMFQVQGLSAQGKDLRYTSVWQSLKAIGQREGIRGYFKGNGANCIRIVPTSAIQFACYAQYKSVLFDSNEITPVQRLIAGSLAGATAQIITYPLDFMRARLTVDMRGQYRGVFSGMVVVARNEGALRLYQGLVPSLAGIMPYVGIDFMVYEELNRFLPVDSSGRPHIVWKLCAGAFAGACGQTVAYPFDTIRRTLQVQHMKVSEDRAYSGMVDCFKDIVKRDGFRGLYRGLWPNYLKVAPSVAISFVTFEAARDRIVSMTTS